jgi:hypothetical protein
MFAIPTTSNHGYQMRLFEFARGLPKADLRNTWMKERPKPEIPSDPV